MMLFTGNFEVENFTNAGRVNFMEEYIYTENQIKNGNKIEISVLTQVIGWSSIIFYFASIFGTLYIMRCYYPLGMKQSKLLHHRDLACKGVKIRLLLETISFLIGVIGIASFSEKVMEENMITKRTWIAESVFYFVLDILIFSFLYKTFAVYRQYAIANNLP